MQAALGQGYWVHGMQLVLNDEDTIPIPLDDFIEEAWSIQYARALHSGDVDCFRARLAHCFALSLADCLDVDLKPPTPAQVQYATDIARQLGVALPSEALRFRGSMCEFIDRFAEAMRQKRRGIQHK